MSIIIPAIDVRGGQCVRLVQGDPNQMTVYSADPVKTAKLWAEKGAKRIHIVDLDGAFSGQPKILDLAGTIKKETGCEIEYGGGLRCPKSIETALSLEIDKLVLGTAALDGLDWICKCIDNYPERFIAAIDARNETVTKEGWTEKSSFSVDEALQKMESYGFQEAIYTDISRDGMMEGPNFGAIRAVVGKTKMGVYASGGISTIEDVKKLREITGLRGMIIGKALYAGTIKLEECFSLE